MKKVEASQSAKRLSLEDFKAKSANNQNQIEKLMGGKVAAAADDCHESTYFDAGMVLGKFVID